MLRTLIVLPDGTELFSGVDTTNAIASCTITESVNSGQDLTLGSACSNMVEAVLITPGGGLTLEAGTEFSLYRVADDGTRTKVGLFTAEKPTKASANGYKITAYDRVSWLDKDLTAWLAGLQGWPYSLYTLAAMVCAECGLALKNTEIPNGSYGVRKFSADGITGRDIMGWIGEAAGRFVRATADGEIELAWYEAAEKAIGPQEADGQYFYYIGGLSFEDYAVEPIDKVQIRLTEDDVGAIWPTDGTGTNAYVVEGNYLLTSTTTEALQPVAKAIYEGLDGVTYTPCKVAIPTNLDIHAGHIVRITDINGTAITAYVMTRKTSGQKDTLECVGSRNRDSVERVNDRKYSALNTKFFNLKMGIEGLSAEAVDLRNELESARSAIQQASDQITAYVESNFVTTADQDEVVRQLKSLISQTSDQVELIFSQVDQRIDNTNEDLSDYKRELQTIIRATAEGVEIGKSDSPYSTLLTNDRLEFRDSGTVAAYISNNKMYITDLEVTHRALLVRLEIKERSSGELIFRYKRSVE